jgi:hypothetical protein
MLRVSNQKLQLNSIRLLGNLLSGTEDEVTRLIAHGVLEALTPFLSSSRKSLCSASCWALSNITAGSPEQIDVVLDAGAFLRLICLLSSSNKDVQLEALWAVANATLRARSSTIIALVEQGVMLPLTKILKLHSTPKVVLICLEAIENVLKTIFFRELDPEQFDRRAIIHKILADLKMMKLMETLELLQASPKKKVVSVANRILNLYCDPLNSPAEQMIISVQALAHQEALECTNHALNTVIHALKRAGSFHKSFSLETGIE